MGNISERHHKNRWFLKDMKEVCDLCILGRKANKQNNFAKEKRVMK